MSLLIKECVEILSNRISAVAQSEGKMNAKLSIKKNKKHTCSFYNSFNFLGFYGPFSFIDLWQDLWRFHDGRNC
jgi:hypothetical protein